MASAKQHPSQATLWALLIYDPESGTFSRRQSGRPAGSRYLSHGYQRIRVAGVLFKSHRLAWIYMHGDIPPDMQIDHINGARDDNRIANLRLATPTQNQRNTVKRAQKRGGLKGVYRRSDDRCWVAKIRDQGKLLHLGCFATQDAANEAYVLAAQAICGEFVRVSHHG